MGGTDGWGEEIVAGGRARSVELDSAILEYLTPPVQFFAHESIEFLRRAAHPADAGFLEFVGDDRIDIHLDDLALNLVDDSAWRAGGRHEPNPGRDIVECRNAGFDRERPDLGQRRQRPAIEFGQRAQLAAMDERKAAGGAIDDVVDCA